MGVKVKGVKRLNANDFDKITITQCDVEDYVVDVTGNEVKTTYDEFSREIKNMVEIDKVIAIIKRYLDDFKINGLTDLTTLPGRDGKWTVLSGCNSEKLLRLQLFNPEFRDIFREIKRKYFGDRYDFFWNEDIEVLLLDSSSCKSSYTDFEASFDIEGLGEGIQRCVSLVLKSDDRWVIEQWERDFVREFLFHKFWQYGEEVKIKGDFEEYSYSLNRSLRGHIIECGDLRVYLPHDIRFGFVFSVVNDYNNELFMLKKEIKERQLKMEGF